MPSCASGGLRFALRLVSANIFCQLTLIQAPFFAGALRGGGIFNPPQGDAICEASLPHPEPADFFLPDFGDESDPEPAPEPTAELEAFEATEGEAVAEETPAGEAVEVEGEEGPVLGQGGPEARL